MSAGKPNKTLCVAAFKAFSAVQCSAKNVVLLDSSTRPLNASRLDGYLYSPSQTIAKAFWLQQMQRPDPHFYGYYEGSATNEDDVVAWECTIYREWTVRATAVRSSLCVFFAAVVQGQTGPEDLQKKGLIME